MPIIILVVFWSEKITDYLKDRNNQPTRIIFYTDTFIINYSLLFALVTSLVFQRNNVDARGWWPVAIIFGELCAILLGLVFAMLALMLNKQHNRYTNGFAKLSLLAMSFLVCYLGALYILVQWMDLPAI